MFLKSLCKDQTSVSVKFFLRYSLFIFPSLVICWGCVTFASKRHVKGMLYSSTGLIVETQPDFGLEV